MKTQNAGEERDESEKHDRNSGILDDGSPPALRQWLEEFLSNKTGRLTRLAHMRLVGLHPMASDIMLCRGY